LDHKEYFAFGNALWIRRAASIPFSVGSPMSSRIILRSAPVDWVLATMTDLSVLLAALHLGLRNTQGVVASGGERGPQFSSLAGPPGTTLPHGSGAPAV